MKTLYKPGIFLLILFLVTIVLLNGNVIASKVNDFYFKAITINSDNLETDSPAYQKHYNLSMNSAAGRKTANIFTIPAGKKEFNLQPYYAYDSGDSGGSGDGGGDGSGEGGGEGDGGDDGDYSSKCSGGEDPAVTNAQNAVTDAQNAYTQAMGA